MALTETTAKALGFSLPHFQLIEPKTQEIIASDQLHRSNGLCVLFICNHCPFVVHVVEQLVQVGKDFLEKGIGFVAINSNDVIKYPDDAPQKMVEFADMHQFPFPYLFDETQEVAKAFDAACTPDIMVFDGEKKCVYQGRLDASRPGNDVPCTGEDLREALEAMLDGEKIDKQFPSMGCNIKWK